MPKKGNAYLAGTVHVGKEVQTKMHIWLEPYMWEKRYKPETGTVHVGKCSPVNAPYLNGASPVPGPIMITGVWTRLGNLNCDLRT